MTLHPATPAATLILYREEGGRDAEHLFVERSAKMVFAAGAVVFPGGRVDPDDIGLAALYPDLDPEDAAARVAAIRETVEEAGVAIGFVPALTTAHLHALRAALSEGVLLSNWLAAEDYRLDLAALVPWARWRPNFIETRIFDTRFYIAQAAADAHPASVDETENVHLFWASAADILLREQAGEVSVIFPTHRNLERLALVPRFTDAVSHSRDFPVQMIMPALVTRDGERYLTIPDDIGYPVTEERLIEMKRGL